MSAQNYKVEYTYDQAGNRKSRMIIPFNSVSGKNSPEKKTTPLEQEFDNKTISIYPNPTQGLLNINISDQDEQIRYNMTIYTLTGKKIIDTETDGNISIDLSDYDTGIYILVLKTTESEIQFKIIKQ